MSSIRCRRCERLTGQRCLECEEPICDRCGCECLSPSPAPEVESEDGWIEARPRPTGLATVAVRRFQPPGGARAVVRP